MLTGQSSPLLGAEVTFRVDTPLALACLLSIQSISLRPRRMATVLRIGLGLLLTFGLTGTSAKGQWTSDGATFAGRFQAWKQAADEPYAPGRAIGASSLAFGPDKSLYLACEKFPELLIFEADGSSYRRVRLEGVLQTKGEPDVDLEAMSIYDGSIYLIDEDKLVVYVTPTDNPGRVRILNLAFDGANSIDTRSTVAEPTDHSSVEGLVVTGTFLGPKAYASELGSGPYFYLLDERDDVNGRKEAKLYVGHRDGDEIRVGSTAVAFDLTDENAIGEGFRLPELFEFRAALYALKTQRGVYRVVKCDLETGQLKEICDFSAFANELNSKQRYGKDFYDNNFEGATVAADGRLFLTADNESLKKGGQGPPPLRDSHRGVTPIVSLRLRP